MTIVNCWLSPARAVMLTDTLPFDHRGRPNGVCSKVAIAPRLNVLCAVRGSLWCLHRWQRWWDEAETLDEAYADADHYAKEIVKAWLEICPDGPSCEFIALAWDPRAGRCTGWLNLPDYDFATIRLEDGTHALPWVPGFPTRERVPLADVVRQQFETAAQTGLSANSGGDGIRATITRRGITVRTLPGLFEEIAGSPASSGFGYKPMSGDTARPGSLSPTGGRALPAREDIARADGLLRDGRRLVP